MTSRFRRPLVIGLVGAGLALAACSTPSEHTFTAAPSAATASPAATSASPAVDPGRPYDAQDVLAAMRESRRPGGVADELQTEEVARQVAEQLWTWDGAPWTSVAVSGSCGPDACTLEIAGSVDGGAGADAYSFTVDPANGAVQLAASDLHGYPAGLDDQLDAIARGELPAASLEGQALLGARWLPPPETGRYWLSYRSGGEEGSPGTDVLVDLAAGTVVETREPG